MTARRSAVGALLAAAALVGRRWAGSRRAKPGGARKERAVLLGQELDAPGTPGRFGDGATRDLDLAEIRALRPIYSPVVDGDPDPGEVIWTWVPYVEHDGRGKDRPVLIIARIGEGLSAGCYLSTKAHSGFVSVGRGGWDSKGRESFLSPERVLLISDAGMRREGQVLPEDRFDRAVAAVAEWHGLRIS